MRTNARYAPEYPGEQSAAGAVSLAVRQRACTYAASLIDEAMVMIGTACTRHEGVYAAYRDRLLVLVDIVQLPADVQRSLAELLGVLEPKSNPDRVSEVLATVASMSDGEILQFVEDLMGLKQRLRQAGRLLVTTLH